MELFDDLGEFRALLDEYATLKRLAASIDGEQMCVAEADTDGWRRSDAMTSVIRRSLAARCADIEASIERLQSIRGL
jgi:hypothetical protein